MSLTMMALRIIAVEAIKAGNTLVGENVLDSEIGAIDLNADGNLETDQKRAFVSVYTDAARDKDIRQSGLRTNGDIELVFSSGISITMATTAENGTSQIIEGFPTTDANFETALDIINAQVAQCLLDPDNKWSQLFGDFINVYVSKDRVRASSSGEGVRSTYSQLKITVSVFADPPLFQGVPEKGRWARLFDLMEQENHPQFEVLQSLFAEIDSGAVPEYERILGITTIDAKNLKLATYGDVSAGVVIQEVGQIVETT